ncbi:excitatory amino acid transporter 3-like [Phlebotomus argentipes]|uniref:excitatory amino acid transporter 3-like n=1 Tax=Phlebotomus argentipes TaxID=94469 RepID=UPI002892B9AE|nr:excitatory amino acid transporter 3-like [Phlebotomus argentipes]
MRGKEYIRENLLTILMVVGVVLGIVIGIVLHTTSSGAWSSRNVMYMQYLGDLFLQMLRGLVLPLIISSLVAAVSSMDMSMSGRIGGLAVAYYMLTTILAIILGIILAITIKPGVNHSVEDGGEEIVGRNTTTADTLLDLVRNLFPPNYIQACLQQYQTHLIPPSENDTEALADINLWKLQGVFIDSTNILGLVVASIVFGIALSSTKKETATVSNLFRELNLLMMKITRWVIWLSPVGVLFLICAKFIESDNLDVFIRLGIYFATVLGGILFHGFAVLPLIYYILTRKNPYILIRHMGQAIATAFGTSSSSATIPVTLQCLEENHGIDPRVTRFMVPIGAAINMDGTALYEAVAVIFIAQLRNVPLSFVDILAISLTATAASIGAASIPQAGLVTMVMVLDVVGLPAEDVSLILAVDWLLDRFRTVINVLGDSFGVGIVSNFSKNLLKKIDAQQLSDNVEFHERL